VCSIRKKQLPYFNSVCFKRNVRLKISYFCSFCLCSSYDGSISALYNTLVSEWVSVWECAWLSWWRLCFHGKHMKVLSYKRTTRWQLLLWSSQELPVLWSALQSHYTPCAKLTLRFPAHKLWWRLHSSPFCGVARLAPDIMMWCLNTINLWMCVCVCVLTCVSVRVPVCVIKDGVQP
jgi:hypothetical protein